MGILELLLGGLGGQQPQRGGLDDQLPPPPQSGPPNTGNIPGINAYRLGGSSDPFVDMIARYGQKYDIDQAYQGYTPSPPSGGAVRGGDNTTAFLQEYLRRQGVGDQAQPMNFRPGDPARTARPPAPMPPDWYQGPAEPSLNQRWLEWLGNQPKPQRPPPGRMIPMLPGEPPPPMAPPGEDIIPGSPGRPWPKAGEEGYLESRRRTRPDMFQGGPMPSPYGSEMLPPYEQLEKMMPQDPEQFRDPGWIGPRDPNIPGYSGYRRPPEGQMVEGPQPLWPSKRRTA